LQEAKYLKYPSQILVISPVFNSSNEPSNLLRESGWVVKVTIDLLKAY
jgi:hypothetical protein